MRRAAEPAGLASGGDGMAAVVSSSSAWDQGGKIVEERGG